MRKKRILLVLGITLSIVGLVYLARRPLFESTIIAEVESQLESLLGVDVEVAAVRGNWVTNVLVEGVEVRGGEKSAYQEISGLDLDLDFSPFALMAGDLSGLSRIRARSKKVVLHVEKDWTSPEFAATPPTAGPPMEVLDLLAMLQKGGTITVDELVIVPDYVGKNSVTVSLDPGRSSRSATVTSGSTKVTGTIDTTGEYDVRLTSDEGGRLLRALDVTKESVDQGPTQVSLRGNTNVSGFATGARIDTQLRDGQPIGLDYLLEWKDQQLRAPRLKVNLPGVSVVGGNLAVPIDELVAQSYHTVLNKQRDGSIAVRIANLAPYASWIDTLLGDSTDWRIQSLFPITSDLRFVLHAGEVRIEESSLRGKGFELRLAAGTLAFGPGDGKTDFRTFAAKGVKFTLEVPEPLAVEIGTASERPTLAGRVTGTISGDLEQLRLDADLALREIAYREFRAAGFNCRAAFDGNELTVTDASLKQIGRAEDAYRFDVAGTAAWNTSSGKLTTALRSEIPDGALAAAGLAADLVAKFTLAPLSVQVDVSLPRDPQRQSIASVRLELPRLQFAELPEFRLRCVATVPFPDGKIADELLIEELGLSGQLGELKVGGTISTANGAYDLTGSGRVLDLEPIGNLLGQQPLSGTLTLDQIHTKGTPTVPLPDVRLTGHAAVTALPRELIPAKLRGHEPKGTIRLDLKAAGTAAGIDVQDVHLTWGEPDRRLDVRGTGTLPIAWSTNLRFVDAAPLKLSLATTVAEPAAELGLPSVTIRGNVEVTAKTLRLPEWTAQTDRGSVKIRDLTLGVDLARAIDDTLAWRAIPVAGQITVNEFWYGALANHWLRPGSLTGRADGSLSLDGTLGAPRLTGALALDEGNLSYPRAPTIAEFRGKLAFTPGAVKLEGAHARSGPSKFVIAAALAVVDDTSLVGALIDGRTPLTGTARVDGLDLAAIGSAVPTVRGLTGAVTCTMTIAGAVPDWNPRLDLSVPNASWPMPDSTTAIEKLSLEAVLTKDAIKISKFAGSVPELDLTLALAGHLAVTDGALWDIPTEKNPQIDGLLQFSQVPLEVLKTLAPQLNIEVAKGVLNCELKVTGSYAALRPDLEVTVLGLPPASAPGAAIKFKDLPRIEGLRATLRANDIRGTLEANAALGAAPVRLDAKLLPGEGELLDAYLGSYLHATLKGSDLLLIRNRGLKLRGDLDLLAKGPIDKVRVSGDVELQKSRYVKRLSLVPNLRVTQGAESGELGPWSIPGGEALVFDVDVKTKEPVQLRTNIIDTDLEIGCRLKGQANNLVLIGTCTSSDGTLRFPGMGMRITRLQLLFSESAPTRPDILLLASGKRHSIKIDLRLHGPLDSPSADLSSTPALQSRDLYSLITTGVRPEALAANTTASNTAILATYVLQELVLSYFASDSTEAKESFVSRFTFEFGQDVSRDGAETWQLDFDIGGLWIIPNRFGTRFERDVYEDFNLGLVYRWRF